MEWLYGLMQEAAEIQRGIYLSFSDRITAYASSRNWSILAAYLHFRILFGAVHAVTPVTARSSSQPT